MFRDRTHGLCALLVLDNAANEHQVRDLIPSGAGCLVLITSRRTMIGLESAATCRLDVFSEAEALDLLRRIVGDERIGAEPEACAELVELCGALPLAVSLAGGRLRSRPTWAVAELCRRLRQSGLSAVGSGDVSLSVLFELSYSALPAGEMRLFRLLSLNPGTEFTAPMATALADVDPARAEAMLDVLQDDHLIWEKIQGRYEVHDLLRAFALDCADRDEPAAGRTEAIDRLLSWYLHTADAAACALNPAFRHVVKEQIPPGRGRLEFAGRDEGRSWLEWEYHNLLAAHSFAVRNHHDEFAARLPRALWGQFSRRASWQDWLEACTAGLEAAQRIGDDRVYNALLLDMGSAHFQARQFENAVSAYEDAAALAEKLGDLGSLATARLNLGQALAGLGRVAEGEAHLQAAIEAHLESGNRYGQAAALTASASVAFHQNSYAEALTRQAAALEIWQELHDAHFEAIAVVNVGHALERLGRLDEAARMLERGVELNRSLGNSLVEASAWECLGEVRAGLQDWPSAVEAYTTARSLVVGVDDARAELLAERISGVDVGNRDSEMYTPHSTRGRS